MSLKNALKVLRDFETKIHVSSFKQFTIDFIQNNESHLNDVVMVGNVDGFGEYADATESDILGTIKYEVDCILDIIKDGKDKELFIELQKQIENL